ncbi:MAG: CRTAC1 family protein [Acidimicrobiia bacterium]|nr:CRTAC1 family protein [Acidimicrobiia bacterium]
MYDAVISLCRMRTLLWGLLPLLGIAGVAETPPFAFTDQTEAAGIQWRHFNGESADRFLIETSSGGVALFDFDNDGLLDIYLVNGGETPKGKSQTAVLNALYRNLGSGRFQDVAGRAGVHRISHYGMGVAVADFDNDGWQDLFVTGYPRCTLFRNKGDGTFVDLTREAGLLNQPEWSASAAWLDYDRDGWLDLFVCNYAQLSFDKPSPCDHAGKPAYCDQRSYEGSRSKLFKNRGDGTFADTSEFAGVHQYVGRAFGVVSVDVTRDGWPDLFVASDATPNLLLVNKQNGTFEDVAFEADVAFNSEGMARSGMGVDVGDVNGDGLTDFVVTNFHDEHHGLYLGTAKLPFQETTKVSGLARFSQPYVGWGVGFLDYDNDSNLDLLIVNGHVTDTIEFARKDIKYKEPPLLLRNRGEAVFENVKAEAGPAFARDYAARGMAFGDFDNDGGMDAIFVCLNGRAVLLHNNAGRERSWMGLELQGRASNRDAIGAKAAIRLGRQTLTRWLRGGGSFLASHDKRLLFGLGAAPASETLSAEIQWPSGKIQNVAGLTPNRYHKIVEPGGEASR